ncbi:hypothetical protein Tco_1159484 [Tanacetum coccineum]
MEWLLMCEDLEKVLGGRNWLDMMIVYCQKFADEHRDFSLRVNRLVGEMNEACSDRIAFVREFRSVSGTLLKTLGSRVPKKMDEFMGEVQAKDIPNLMKLQILGREFELRAREKDLFIEKLKGNMDF